MGRSGCSRSWLPLAPFVWALSSLLMQCVQIHATARAWAGMAKKVARRSQAFFLSSNCGLSPSNGSPLPPSSFVVSPEKLHFRRAGSSWPWSNSNTIYKSDQCSLQKSLSFDVSDTTTLTCTNVPQNDSWPPQLAMPSCASLPQLRQCSARLSLGILRRGKKESLVPQTAGCSPVWQAPPDLHCGHRLVFDICISTANWIRPASRRSSQACATTYLHTKSTPVRAIGRTTSRLSHRLCMSTAAYRQWL